MNKTRLCGLCLLVIMISFSCRKNDPPITEEPTLPEITKTGAFTFGCYINDELFVANAKPGFSGSPAVSGSYNKFTGRLVVTGLREDEEGHLDKVTVFTYAGDTGNYHIDVTGDKQYGYIDFAIMGSDCDRYFHSEMNPGTVNILRLDTVENIVSGTFEYVLNNEKCSPKELKITKGRFDLRF